MTYGLATDFLVASEIVDHPFHQSAGAPLQKHLADEQVFALAPQTLAEFIHIVTDKRRMPSPLIVTNGCDLTSGAVVASRRSGARISRWEFRF